MGGPRITLQTLQVLGVLLADAATDHYGLDISRAANLPTGSVYPILARLEAAGWLESSWEELDEAVAGRRRRRYYRLTNNGSTQAVRELAKAQRKLGGIAEGPRPELGGSTA